MEINLSIQSYKLCNRIFHLAPHFEARKREVSHGTSPRSSKKLQLAFRPQTTKTDDNNGNAPHLFAIIAHAESGLPPIELYVLYKKCHGKMQKQQCAENLTKMRKFTKIEKIGGDQPGKEQQAEVSQPPVPDEILADLADINKVNILKNIHSRAEHNSSTLQFTQCE